MHSTEDTYSADAYRASLQAIIDGCDLTDTQSHAMFTALMDGELDDVQIAALLAALVTKGHAISEIVGAARAMREHAVRIDPGCEVVVDIVGTGGTGINTFNVSTTTCFVAAGAGAKVAKHGNITNTRASGSADVLAALGVNLAIEPATVTQCIQLAGVGFCYARNCHPAMKYAAPVRKQLPVRTIFNILGPLTNPAGATRQLMGVYTDALTEPLARVLGELGLEKAWVVHGGDGTDEISITAPTRISQWTGESVETITLTPEDAGLPRATLADLAVASPEESATAVRAVLAGQPGPKRDIVVLNTAAALVVTDQARDLKEGVAQACESIDSGAARAALEKLIAVSNG